MDFELQVSALYSSLKSNNFAVLRMNGQVYEY